MVTPYMVFYLLTPVGQGSYSYINLCPPYPAEDVALAQVESEGI